MRRTRRRRPERDSTEGRGRSRSRSRTDGGSTARSAAASSRVERIHRSAGNQAVQRQEADGDESRAMRPIEDAEGYDVDVSREALLTAVTTFLEERGLTPPPESSLELGDYVSTTAWQRGGSYSNTTASVRVGRDGTLLPSADYLDANRPESGYAESSLEPATRLLQFQVDPVGDGSALVVSRLTRVESSVIKSQEDAWAEDSPQGYLDGLDESFERSGIEIERAGTGRVPPEERRYRDQGDDPATGLERGESGGGSGDGGSASGSSRGPGGRREGESGLQSPEKPETGTPVGPATTGGRGSEYVVREGDTLWDVAAREYCDARLWPAIYEAPGNDIRDPDLIQPGQTLTVPPQSTADAFDRDAYTPPSSTGIGRGTF